MHYPPKKSKGFPFPQKKSSHPPPQPKKSNKPLANPSLLCFPMTNYYPPTSPRNLDEIFPAKKSFSVAGGRRSNHEGQRGDLPRVKGLLKKKREREKERGFDKMVDVR